MSVPTSQAAPGTYTFAPAASDIVLYAFSLCGIRPTELSQHHYVDAAMAANLAMVNLTNRLPLRFAIELQTVPLVQGTATYNLATRTVAAPIVTIGTTSGGVTTERVIGPISSYEYRALPTKAQEGPPTSYWFNLGHTPQLVLWPVPDDAATYTAYVQTLRQLQDVDLTNSQGVDSPYRFLDTLTTDIAARLAESYQPAKAPPLYALAKERFALAIARDIEDVPMTISPALSGYYRTF